MVALHDPLLVACMGHHVADDEHSPLFNNKPVTGFPITARIYQIKSRHAIMYGKLTATENNDPSCLEVECMTMMTRSVFHNRKLEFGAVS